jgi:Glycosyltransferase family 87
MTAAITSTAPRAVTNSRTAKYLRDFLLGILPIMFGAQLFGWIAFFPQALHGNSDFRQLYTAAYMIRTGHAHELYDYQAQKRFQDALVSREELALPFIRPAYQAVAMVPFSLFRYRTAYLLFLALNFSLLVPCFSLLRPHMQNLSAAWRWLPPAMLFTFLPANVALMQGQDSIFLLVLLAAAFVALHRGRGFSAGTLVGLGLFKLQIVVPIAILFFAWRRWRFSAGFAVSSAFAMGVSFWVIGLAQAKAFVHSLFAVGGAVAPAANQIKFPLRTTLMANLRGLIAGLAAGKLSSTAMLVLTISLSAAVLLALATLLRKQAPADAMMLAITASVVVSYYLFIHDLSVLLIPIVVILDRYIGLSAASSASDGFTAILAATLFVAPICLFLIPAQFYIVALPICALLMLSLRGEEIRNMSPIAHVAKWKSALP